ncbi:hypothetical protein WA158_008381 [Blastocystis sp. Blastoise]
MADFGELILVVSDLHIPFRGIEIPAKFKAMLVPDKFKHIVCAGNLCTSEQVELFKSLSEDNHIIKGDFDEFLGDYPYEDRFSVGDWTFGVCHGHQLVPNGDHSVLNSLARKLDVNVLITGHTHKLDVFKENSTLFLNPGSFTGAFTPSNPDNHPTFILLAVKDDKLTVFTYQLKDNKLDVKKTEYTKSEL